MITKFRTYVQIGSISDESDSVELIEIVLLRLQLLNELLCTLKYECNFGALYLLIISGIILIHLM